MRASVEMPASDARPGRPMGAIPAIDPRCDARFRHLTGLGNAAFHAGDAAAADRFYRDALSEAGCLLDAAEREAGAILVAPMALTIAANNLAAAMGLAGAAEAARAVSIEAVDRLIATAQSADRPIALRLNCLRHLRHALHCLATLDREHGHPADAMAPISERAVRAVEDVVRVAALWMRTPRAAGIEPHPRRPTLS